jgi:TatA/E family protein of Tat protein translocase
MGPLGWQETLFIFVFALLIFGPKKLPELGKTIGKAMTEFRRASSELRSTWDREMVALERENESLQNETRKIQNEVTSSYNDTSDNGYYDSGYEYGYEGNPTNGSSTSTADSSTVSGSATQDANQPAVSGESSSDPAPADEQSNAVEAAGSPEKKSEESSDTVRS